MHTRWPGSGVPFGPIRGPHARTRPGFLRPIATGILVERPTAANGGCDEEWPLCEDLPVAVTLIPRSRESRRGCDKPARPPCGTRFLHKSSPDNIQEKPRVPRPASRVPRPASHVPRPASHVPRPASRVPRPTSHVPRPAFRQDPAQPKWLDLSPDLWPGERAPPQTSPAVAGPARGCRPSSAVAGPARSTASWRRPSRPTPGPSRSPWRGPGRSGSCRSASAASPPSWTSFRSP